MSAISLPLEENQRTRTARGLARLLSPAPTVGLHSVASTEREQVEQYIFDQFQANHGASIREFMPFLFTTVCGGALSAAVGVRPAYENELFLEQYLPETAEKLIGDLAGKTVKREELVEIGSLVASHAGSSQLVYLIMAAILHRAGFKWLIITATPQVQKAINRLGFELYPIGSADPSALSAKNLSDWGSYYESRPQIVAGNLAEAMDVLSGRKIYQRLMSLYQHRIDAMALIIRQSNRRVDQHCFAA